MDTADANKAVNAKPAGHIDILIVGAGISGIGTGIELLRRKQSSFVLLEAAKTIGKTSVW